MRLRKPQISKIILILVIAVPIAILVYSAATNQLGPDPAEYIVGETGEWTIRFLCLTLFITPLALLQRKMGRLKSFRPLKYRRILGVTTWVYAVLHMLAYSAFIFAWQWGEIGSEIIERPYIAVGLLAVLLMTPLAITSTDSMVRRLKKNWRKLHKLIYIVAVLAVIHIVWQVRSDAGNAILYGSLVFMLLLQRVLVARRLSKRV